MTSSVLNMKGQIIEELFVMVLRHVHRRRWVTLCYVCAAWRNIVQKLLWEDVDYGFLKVLAETSMVPGMDRYIVCLGFYEEGYDADCFIITSTDFHS